ncbi:MAG: SDR family oxidoreductase [Victivallaceae bacterium]|nr:SDR family oxidoreductase [Victivallaceae bacterium]
MVLKEKRVLITGAAKRIGAVIARRFHETGAKVVIHCDRSIDEARALSAQLPGSRVVAADLSDAAAVQRLIEETYPIDLLVNNASLFRYFCNDEEPLPYMAVNLEAPVALIRAMAANPRPEMAVVNVLDQYAADEEAVGNYADSRRRLAAATITLAAKFAGIGLRINAVSPGPMLPPVELPESKMKNVTSGLPLKKAISPDNLADMIIELCRNDSITGAIVPVDGGLHLVQGHRRQNENAAFSR